MNTTQRGIVDRFVDTLVIVHREGEHLDFSRQRVFAEPVTAEGIRRLDHEPEAAERLEAFVSRFGRMQDTIGNKLLPRWLRAQAEEPGTLIEVLNRAERLGMLASTEDWLSARALRNRLVHEYMEDPDTFAEDLQSAEGYTSMLLATHNRIRDFAIRRMQLRNRHSPDPCKPRVRGRTEVRPLSLLPAPDWRALTHAARKALPTSGNLDPSHGLCSSSAAPASAPANRSPRSTPCTQSHRLPR